MTSQKRLRDFTLNGVKLRILVKPKKSLALKCSLLKPDPHPRGPDVRDTTEIGYTMLVYRWLRFKMIPKLKNEGKTVEIREYENLLKVVEGRIRTCSF